MIAMKALQVSGHVSVNHFHPVDVTPSSQAWYACYRVSISTMYRALVETIGDGKCVK